MFRQLVFFIIIGLLSLTDLFGQEWIQYTEGRNINAIAEYDNKIWVATDAGLVRLDQNGQPTFYNTANSELPSHFIYAIEILSDNKLYIGTGEGLVIYDGTEFQLEYDFGRGDINSVSGIGEDSKGNVWISVLGIGLLKRNGNSWETYNVEGMEIPSNAIRAMHIDNTDKVWIGYRDNGLAVFDPATNTSLHFDEDNSIVGKKEIRAITSLNNGEVWVATIGGMHRYVNNEWDVFAAGNTEEINGDYMYSVIPGINNDLWIGTHGGLLYYKDGVWDYTLSYANNEPVDYIISLFIDSTDKLWNGTNNGLYSLSNLEWEPHNTSLTNIPDNYIAAVRELQDGTLWIGSFQGDRGLYSYDGSEFTDHTDDLPVGLYNGLVELEVNDNGYIAAAAGFTKVIYVYDGNEWRSQTLNSTVNDFEFDREDNLWASTIRGIYRVNQGATTLFDMSNTNMISDRFYDLAIDTDGILYAASREGLISYDGNSWDQVNIDNPILHNGELNGVFFDKEDRLWVAHDGGISVREANTWTNYDSSNSPIPTDQRTFRFIQDNQGVIWARLYKGLMRIDGDEWKLLTTLNSGLTRNDVGDLYPAMDGGIWIATSIGLIYHKYLKPSASHEQDRNELNVVLYPNPANEQVVVSLGEYTGKASIKLVDSQGQLVLQKKIQVTPMLRIDLPHISGVYWMHINTELGQQTIKVVKP